MAYQNSMSMSINEMEAEIKESEEMRLDQCVDKFNRLPDKNTPRTIDARFDILYEMAGIPPSNTNQIHPE